MAHCAALRGLLDLLYRTLAGDRSTRRSLRKSSGVESGDGGRCAVPLVCCESDCRRPRGSAAVATLGELAAVAVAFSGGRRDLLLFDRVEVAGRHECAHVLRAIGLYAFGLWWTGERRSRHSGVGSRQACWPAPSSCWPCLSSRCTLRDEVAMRARWALNQQWCPSLTLGSDGAVRRRGARLATSPGDVRDRPSGAVPRVTLKRTDRSARRTCAHSC